MLVSRVPDGWQLVAQADHAELAGALAAVWGGGPFAAAEPATVGAAIRHDDGWAVSDRRPRIDREGRPESFLDAPVPALLSSYQAAVDLAAAEDPEVGLLISMHVSGLRRGRYGLAPDRPGGEEPPAVDPVVERFLREEESRQRRLAEVLGRPETARWHAYAQLQLLDVLSLELILAPQRPHRLPRAATAVGAPPVGLTLAPVADGVVAVEPYPFSVRPLELRFARRVLAGGPWKSHGALRADLAEVPWEVAGLELR